MAEVKAAGEVSSMVIKFHMLLIFEEPDLGSTGVILAKAGIQGLR